MTSDRPPAATPTGSKASSPPDLLDLASTASPLTAPGETARASSTTTIARAARTGRVPRNPATRASHIKQTGVNTLAMIRPPPPMVAATVNNHSSGRRTVIVNRVGTRDRAHSTRVNAAVMIRKRTGGDHVSRAMKISKGSAQAIEVRGGTSVPARTPRTAPMYAMQRRATRVAPQAQGAPRDTKAVASRTGATVVEKSGQKRAIRATLASKAGQSALLAASRNQTLTAPQRNFLKATTNTLTQSSSLLKTRVTSCP